MLDQALNRRVNVAKKLAAKGKTGLFFATLWLATVIILGKVWKYIKLPVFRMTSVACLAAAFIINSSFAPVPANLQMDYAKVSYADLVIAEELEPEEYVRTEMNEEDEVASLDDLKAGIEESHEVIEEAVPEKKKDDFVHVEIIPLDEEENYDFDKSSWNLLLVNKQHPIPDDYTFTLGTIKGNMKCDERILEPLTRMFEAAADDGINLIVCSPYRDMSRQEYLFDRKMKTYINSGYSYIDAYKEASAVVTVPGASEHQIGISLDIICDHYSQLDEGFGETDAGQWLKDNSYRFGFILRYPKDKEDITGIIYEPWHFRYVGPEAAKVIHNKDLTLEEFVEGL